MDTRLESFCRVFLGGPGFARLSRGRGDRHRDEDLGRVAAVVRPRDVAPLDASGALRHLGFAEILQDRNAGRDLGLRKRKAEVARRSLAESVDCRL